DAGGRAERNDGGGRRGGAVGDTGRCQGAAGSVTPAAALAGVIAAAGVMAWLGTGALIPLLRQRAVLDQPNERSSHAVPTPRGGGLAVISAIVFAWVVMVGLGVLPYASRPILVGALLLAAVSWIDDVRGL